MNNPQLGIFRLDSKVRLPVRGTSESIGFDVYAFLLTESGMASKKMIPRYNTVAIPTGLVVDAPPGYYVQCCSRSGLAFKSLFVANSPGIVDPDYTGEIKILLYNGGYETQWIEHGQRIAQLVLAPIFRAEVREILTRPLKPTRGDAGFGSTGT